MEPVIAEYYISIVSIRHIHLAGYHRVAIIFVIMNSAAIFIAVVHLVSPAIIIFELLPFQVMNLIIERKFLIKLGTLYMMKWVVILL